MDFDGLIARLGLMIGISDLAFDADGCCSVNLDDDEFHFEKIKDRLVVIAPLGPAEKREELYRLMLEGNFMGKDSALGSIGINSEQEEFVLSRYFEGEESYETFEESLLIMLKTVRSWKEILKNGLPEDKSEQKKKPVLGFKFV